MDSPRVPFWRAASDRVTLTDDVVRRFASYYDRHPAWGLFHAVLDEGNCHDSTAARCCVEAIARGSGEELTLSLILLSLSRTQRRILPYRAEAWRQEIASDTGSP